jgi:hypothetical protein
MERAASILKVPLDQLLTGPPQAPQAPQASQVSRGRTHNRQHLDGLEATQRVVDLSHDDANGWWHGTHTTGP